MRKLALTGLTFCLCVFTAVAQQPAAEVVHGPFDGAPTLDYCLRRSDWVVVGTLKTRVDGFVGGGRIGSPGKPVLAAAESGAEIEVLEVLKGNLPAERNLPIELCFFYVSEGVKPANGVVFNSGKPQDQPEDSAPFGYRQGAKYIFFLQKFPAGDTAGCNGKLALARTTDPWFGVLPFSEALVLGLKEAFADRRSAEGHQ